MDTLLMELESINHELRMIGVMGGRENYNVEPFTMLSNNFTLDSITMLPKTFMDHADFNERVKVLEAAEATSMEEVKRQQAILESIVDSDATQKRRAEHNVMQARGRMIHVKLATLHHWQNMVSIDASEFYTQFARLIDRKTEIYKEMHAMKHGGA